MTADVVAAAAGQATGLVARYSGPGDANMYLAQLANAGAAGNYVQIWRSVGGVWSLLSSVKVAASSGTLRFTVAGTSLRSYLDGQLITAATDSSITAAGSVGLRAVGGV